MSFAPPPARDRLRVGKAVKRLQPTSCCSSGLRGSGGRLVARPSQLRRNMGGGPPGWGAAPASPGPATPPEPAAPGLRCENILRRLGCLCVRPPSPLSCGHPPVNRLTGKRGEARAGPWPRGKTCRRKAEAAKFLPCWKPASLPQDTELECRPAFGACEH